MADLKMKKDSKKTLTLALFPGLGFLYVEKPKYFLLFFTMTFLPLLLKSTTGDAALLMSVAMYVISIYYSYSISKESLKNKSSYKKDPYYVMCLSLIYDGLGQFQLKQYKKAYFMMTCGMMPCLITWIVLVYKVGFVELVMSPKGTTLFYVTNLLIIWFIASVPIKALSLIDAYYSTYHLYVAKK